jgi:hypothetical protein
MGGALTLLALCMAPEEAIIRDAMNGDGPTTPLVDCAAKALHRARRNSSGQNACRCASGVASGVYATLP